MTHELKTIQPYFNDVLNGKKTFEIRKFDRPYKVGDSIKLIEWDVNLQRCMPNFTYKTISYVLSDAVEFGLIDGYCILGFVK